MPTLLARIAAKKAELDRLRQRAPFGLNNLQHVHDLEITHTSNAIEGNTLTATETSEVIEKGITVGGKPLKDHLEAIDHHEALHYIRDLARQSALLAETDIRSIHALVVKRSNPDIAGRCATQGRFVLTDSGRHTFPSPAPIPALMAEFVAWLLTEPAGPTTAFEAHRRLAAIHPFDDGNGRTARLLMNLLLLRAGYPPISVRPQDRAAYLRALQDSQAGLGADSFHGLLADRLDATLDEYLETARQALPG